MNKRITWIDLLRIIGMIGVLTIHVVGNTINTLGLSGTPNLVYTVICQSFYFSLPLFVMVSGSLLLSKDISYKEIFLKYIKRMVLVLLIFGSLFTILEEYFITKTIGINIFGKIFNNIITGSLWDHMWYIYLMIGLYLITPLLRKYIMNSNKKELVTLLAIVLIFTIIKTDICNLFNINTAIFIPLGSNFIFAYLLGNYLYNNDLSKKSKTILHIIGFLSFITIIILSICDTHEFLIGYTTFLCTAVAIDVYVIIKNKEFKNKNLSNLICELGKCSFGIYVLHQLFINIVYKWLKIDLILSIPYTGLFLYVILLLIITFIFVYLLRKISIIRKNLL